MNILQVLPALDVGGVETGALDLAKYLVRSGHKAVVVSSGGALVRDLEATGAIHYQLPVRQKSFLTMLRTVPKLVEIIKKEEIDIVHARSRVPAWIAYFACRKTKKVFITTCHGYYQKHPFSHIMGWGKLVIVLSNVIARHMIDDFKVPYERLRFIARSVDLEKFTFLDPVKKRGEEFNVCIVARITPLKGHLDFIKAMSRVNRVIPRLKIWIVGDAPPSKEAYKEQLQVLVKRLGLWHCTQFLGFQKDIPDVLRQMDLLVLPTIAQEAFGRVIIEAQASGVPVIATKVGGIIDIIEDGKTGLLVSPQDPQGIADAVLRIFKEPKFATQLAQNAYKNVKEKYNIELMVKNTLEVYQEALTNFKILVIKFSSLGDIILSTAALRAIRKNFPSNYKLSFLTFEANKDLLLRSPYIDELLVFDHKNRDKGTKGLWRLGEFLRKKNFDIVIDLQNNRKSHILASLSLAPERYGYDRKFGFLLNHTVKDNLKQLDPLTHQFRILDMLGIELEDRDLELWPGKEEIEYIDGLLGGEWLSSKQKLIGINLGASPRWQSKAWPMNNLVKLIQELSRLDLRIVITGTGNDQKPANELISRLANVRIINACGKTGINELACLIKRCHVYISGDSAPLHVAVSQGVPLVALFGPTDPARHLAATENYILLKKDLPCSPCYKSKCKTKDCMESITPQEVLEAVKKLLKL